MNESSLLTDLYQLAMLQAYRRYGFDRIAVFELSVRTLPDRRGFLMAAGLEQALDFLEALQFSAGDLAYLRAGGRFPDDFVESLSDLRFTGDVDAVPEGTIFFAQEPILRVTAPMPQAQLVETRLINLLHFQTLIASKAARMVLAAPGKLLVDFGLRRAHGAEAGLLAARAAYITGFAGTATVEAGQRFGIPLYGTMAHSFIEAHDREVVAFEEFARTRPEGLVLLIDTYNTEHAAHEVVALAERLATAGIRIRGVRIDSGDLAAQARRVREILDAGGLTEVTIFGSGGLDEDDLVRFVREEAPIDGFGMGTSLATSSDAPALDCAYKLQVYDGIPRRKLSPGKASWPGAKQVWRSFDDRGTMLGDRIALAGDAREGVPLLAPVMRAGKRVHPQPSLAAIRKNARANLAQLPRPLASLEHARYRVEIDEALQELAAATDRRIAE
ncbi:MAG TPA: nicotinate phosphoribosyltransferase [Candidatus Baltobacteraceae bacterium]|nr:nicotinate phosphoribosyltransferase [Candidatus Baltobacteraceae bacterium]